MVILMCGKIILTSNENKDTIKVFSYSNKKSEIILKTQQISENNNNGPELIINIRSQRMDWVKKNIAQTD